MNGKRRVGVRKAVAWALPLLLLAALAVAGSNSTNLPNGAELSVSITDPVTSTEFKIDPGDATIDVEVTGTAAVGLGEPDATFVYVIDTSGSTSGGSGTGCSPVLDCEKKFFVQLNDDAIASGSTDLAGVVRYGSTSSIALGLTDPTNPAVDAAINGLSAGGATNCAAGLSNATALVNSGANTNGTSIVVFASDGRCNSGGSVTPAATALGATGAIVYSVAVGTGSDCTTDGGTGRLNQIPRNGGQCFEVADPGNLPDIIPDLIGSSLDSLEIAVNGGGATPIPNSEISLPLPQPGAVGVNYTTTVTGLGPGDHEICVTANGSDSTGGTASVTQCETIHVLQLTASPAEATNELGSDNEHTVTATILGDPAQVAGRLVDFSVSGQNAGATGTCSPNADCTTNAAGQVSFTYTVPIEPDSLGTDTITVSTIIAGEECPIDLEKLWEDTTPPEPSCTESVNPHGKKTPPAGSTTLPGPKGGQNEDGFYELGAVDDVWPEGALAIFVNGFGPFAVDDVIKYTQDDEATPISKKMGSDKGNAGAVAAHIIGNGDASVVAVDGSGNASDPLECLVPQPPK
jgi:hypothetical protein